MSRHAQERRTVKLAKAASSPKMTAILETAPLAGLILIAFGGSCSNIFRFFGACGTTGIFQYADTAGPDLLCLVAFREILRDRRLKREHKGWMSWPVLVVIFGIALTLALGYIGNDKTLLANIADHWMGHLAGPLPGLLLLIALSLFHRRDTGTEAAGTKRDRRKAAASTGTAERPQAAPVPPETAPAATVSTAPVPAEVPAGEESAQPWTDDDLVAEARRQWAEHAEMGVRLSQGRFEMALKQSPRGGAGRNRVIKALGVVRAEMDGAPSEAEAVGQ